MPIARPPSAERLPARGGVEDHRRQPRASACLGRRRPCRPNAGNSPSAHATAVEALYRHDRDRRSSSTVYRRLLSAGSGRLRLKDVQATLAESRGMLLEYVFGDLGGHVLAITAQKRPADAARRSTTARRQSSTARPAR